MKTKQLDPKSVRILSMARGAAGERLEDALADVIENCLDPNTKAKYTRKINLEISIIPNEKDRRFCEYRMKCATKLSHPDTIEGSLQLSMINDMVGAFENNPDQGEFNFSRVSQNAEVEDDD